ncbi:MAG: lipid-A-disaccharide synthase [Symploca sp. SIO2G7]|nr:lipid-A-disaccharide synthase [Symploca sp. SIO2G7]
MKRIFISTGEVSGDLQGALLIEALKRQAATIGLELEIVALGGEKMAKAGAKLLSNTTGIGSIGLLESLPFMLPTWEIQRRAKQYLRQNPPDVVVLIDYMGPNLNLGNFIQRELPQVIVVYYIAPQSWVWSAASIVPRETATIVKITDKLLAIFPEEARFFEKKGASVNWIGHPLVDRMQSSPTREEARAALGIEPEQIAIALLPASRRQELKYMMPIVFEAARRLQLQLEGRFGDGEDKGDAETRRRGDAEVGRWGDGEDKGDAETRRRGDAEMGRWEDKGAILNSQFPIPNSQFPIPKQQKTNDKRQKTNDKGQKTNDKRQMTNDKRQTTIFWIPLSLEAYRYPIEAAIERYGLKAKVIAGKNQEVLAAADLAIAKSGTVNLELALLDVPQVVLYRVSFITYLIGRILKFTILFMSPPNLVVMRSIVPELLQEKATPENLVKEALELLFDQNRRQQTLTDYQEMRQLLGEVGVCDRAAREILELAG